MLVRVPKPTGGHRLIALLHDHAKLWGVMRRPPAAEWGCLHGQPEFWGGAGKSSTRAVFQSRLDCEVARELGGSSISILLDQEKCYEMVPFSCLWQDALSSDFSPALRWMVVQSYGQPRVIKGLGSYSYQVQTKHGILAGCPLTTTLFRVPSGHLPCWPSNIPLSPLESWSTIGPSIGALPILMVVAFAEWLMRLKTP